METSLEGQKEQLMREGYVIVRDIIPPDELERLRESVEHHYRKSTLFEPGDGDRMG